MLPSKIWVGGQSVNARSGPATEVPCRTAAHRGVAGWSAIEVGFPSIALSCTNGRHRRSPGAIAAWATSRSPRTFRPHPQPQSPKP